MGFSLAIWCIVPILIITPHLIRPIIAICKKKSRDSSRTRNGRRHRTQELHIFPTEEKDICSCLPCQQSITSTLYREYMFSRYNAFLSRLEYILSQIAIGLIFYSFPYSILIRNIGSKHAYIFNIVFHVIQLISIQIFLKISLGDPGIIRNKGDAELFSADANITESTRLTNSYRRNYKHSFEPISIDPDNTPASFCWRCKIVRPLRSKHDYDIDACVACYDHYSPKMGNAIGAYNHKFFVLVKVLDIITCIMCIYIIIDLFVLNIVHSYSSVLGWSIIVLTLLYILYFVKDPILIFVYHLYLAMTNQTTYEIIKPQMNQKTMELLDELRSNDVRNNRQPRRGRIGRYYDPISFDEGYVRNLILFLKGYDEKIEYFYGFQCVLKSSDDSDESYQLDNSD